MSATEALRASATAADPADGLEYVSGEVISPEEELFTAQEDETLSAASIGAEQDPWWEMASVTRPLPTLRPTWGQRLRRLTSGLMPFGLRERAVPPGTWRVRAFLLMSVAVLVGLTAVMSVAAFGFASRLVRGAPSQLPLVAETPTSQGGVIIQPNTGGSNPTPAMPSYLIGTWAASNAPSGGSVQVFVRVTRADGANAPVPAKGIPVRLAVGGSGYGPVATDAYGLATFTVHFGGGYSGYAPIFVTASATVGGKTITAQTSFAPR